MALAFAAATTSSSSCSLLFLRRFSPRTATAVPYFLLPRRRRPSTTSLSASSGPSPADRLLSASVYLFPLVDGARHARFLAAYLPALRPLLSLSGAFHSSSLPSFLVFLSLYLGVVRNPASFPRFVRFNAMQAVALDILIIFPDLFTSLFNSNEGLPRDFLVSLDNTVFLYLLVCFIYASYSCLSGTLPRLPLVANAAENSVP